MFKMHVRREVTDSRAAVEMLQILERVRNDLNKLEEANEEVARAAKEKHAEDDAPWRRWREDHKARMAAMLAPGRAALKMRRVEREECTKRRREL